MRELENELESEQKKGQEYQKVVRKYERRIKELSYQVKTGAPGRHTQLLLILAILKSWVWFSGDASAGRGRQEEPGPHAGPHRQAASQSEELQEADWGSGKILFQFPAVSVLFHIAEAEKGKTEWN